LPVRPRRPAATDRGAIQQLQEQLGREGFAQLLESFLDRGPDRLAELRAAAGAGDAPGLREQARSLKGAARSFGAAEIGELALRLEQESQAGSLAGADGLIHALEASLARTEAEFRAQLEPRIVDAIRVRPGSAQGDRTETAAASPDTRLAELDRRIASLERSLLGLLSRLN
jgi:HPt (histidine-containing phosphotransfer) domain-containing protein